MAGNFSKTLLSEIMSQSNKPSASARALQLLSGNPYMLKRYMSNQITEIKESTTSTTSTNSTNSTTDSTLYLDSTKNLISLYNASGSALPAITSVDGYSSCMIETFDLISITINTNIYPSDEFEIIVVGGGGGGIEGDGTKEVGGGAGGGFCRAVFNKIVLPIGTQFACRVGAGGLQQEHGEDTSLNLLLSNDLFITSTGGKTGNRGTPDNNPQRSESGTVILNDNVQYFCTTYLFTDSRGGIGSFSVENGGDQEGLPLTSTYPTPNNIIYGKLFCGGGGGGYFEAGNGRTGSAAGNGYGGDGIRTSWNSEEERMTGENGLTWGAGGGAGGGDPDGGIGYPGGAGHSGCIYVRWKTR